MTTTLQAYEAMQAEALAAAVATSDAYKAFVVAHSAVANTESDDSDLANDDRVWDLTRCIGDAVAELASMYRYISMLDPSTPSVNGSDSLTTLPSNPQPAPDPGDPGPDPE